MFFQKLSGKSHIQIKTDQNEEDWFITCDYKILCVVCWDEAKELNPKQQYRQIGASTLQHSFFTTQSFIYYNSTF